MIKNISRLCGEEPKGKTYKYEISYVSGATCFGWENACDTIDEVMEIISDIYIQHNAMVTVWDNNFDNYIFFKSALSQPTINMIKDYSRDLRTTTRKSKLFA